MDSGQTLDILQAKAILSRILDTKRENDPPSVRIKKSRSFELERSPAIMINKEQAFESKYKLLEELGKGMFGTVKKCECNDTGIEYAAKVVRKTTKSKEEVVREISTMNQLQHKSIAQIHDAFESNRQMIIVMELIRGKELFEKVAQEDTLLTEKQCVYYLRQILSGVEYMHKKKIVHLDLKPENILCIDSPQGYDEIKLIDFGLARDLSSNNQLSCICGTPEFVAPEVINFDPISVQSDMWSLGVITYVLLSGISPFLGDDDGETLQNVTFGEFDFEDEDGTFEHISEDAKEFISDLLCTNPKDRLTVEDCLEHPWLNTQTNEEELDTTNLKKFIARRRWLRTIHAIKAVGRFTQVAGSLGGKKGGSSLAKTMLAALNASNKEKSEDKCTVKEIISQSTYDNSTVDQSVSEPETSSQSNGFHEDKIISQSTDDNSTVDQSVSEPETSSQSNGFHEDKIISQSTDANSTVDQSVSETESSSQSNGFHEDKIISQSTDANSTVDQSVSEPESSSQSNGFHEDKHDQSEVVTNGNTVSTFGDDDEMSDMLKKRAERRRRRRCDDEDEEYDIFANISSKRTEESPKDKTESDAAMAESLEASIDVVDDSSNATAASSDDFTKPSPEPSASITAVSDNISTTSDDTTENYDVNNNEISVAPVQTKIENIEKSNDVQKDISIEKEIMLKEIDEKVEQSNEFIKEKESPNSDIQEAEKSPCQDDVMNNKKEDASETVEKENSEKPSQVNITTDIEIENEKSEVRNQKVELENEPTEIESRESHLVETEKKEAPLPGKTERRRELSPCTSSEKKESAISTRREKSPVSIKPEESPEPIKAKESPEPTKAKESPEPTKAKQLPKPTQVEKTESSRCHTKSKHSSEPEKAVENTDHKVEKAPPKTSSKPSKVSPKKSKVEKKDEKVKSPKNSRKIGSKISGLLNKVSSPKSQRKPVSPAKDKKLLSPKSPRKLASKFEMHHTDSDSSKSVKSPPPPTSKKPAKSPPVVKDKPSLKNRDKPTSTDSSKSEKVASKPVESSKETSPKTPEKSTKAAPPPTSPKKSTAPAVQKKPSPFKTQQKVDPPSESQSPSVSTKLKGQKGEDPTQPKNVTTDSSTPQSPKPEETASSPKSPSYQDRLRNRLGSHGNSAKTNMPVSGKDKKGIFMAWENRVSTPEQSRRTFSTSSPLTNRNLIAARKASLNRGASQERSFDSSDGSSIEDRTSSPVVGRFTRNSSVRASLNENNLATTRKRLVTKPHSIANVGSVKNKMAIFAKFQKQ